MELPKGELSLCVVMLAAVVLEGSDSLAYSHRPKEWIAIRMLLPGPHARTTHCPSRSAAG